MPKKEAFQVEHYYVANYGGKDRTNRTKTPVKVSKPDELLVTLQQMILEDRPNALSKLLHSKYIYSIELNRFTKTTHNTFQNKQHGPVVMSNHGGRDIFIHYYPPISSGGRGQRDDCTYACLLYTSDAADE